MMLDLHFHVLYSQEARAVFRQTMAAATYHLNAQAHKLGKCIDKARPFYDVLREMRKVGHFRPSS